MIRRLSSRVEVVEMMEVSEIFFDLIITQIRKEAHGFRQKNLQKIDSMQLEGGFGGIRDRFDLISPLKLCSFYLVLYSRI
jgi:hypothetical protein